MKKKSLLISLILIAIATSATVAMVPKTRAATTTISISTVVVTEPGTTFLVNITVTDVSDLSAWLIDMSWNSSVIKVTTGDSRGLRVGGTRYNIYEGPFLSSIRSTVFLASSIDNNNGIIIQLVAAYLSAGSTPSGSGVLASINFTSIAVGNTLINITGPSVSYPGRCMLIDHAGKEIYHEDIDGAVLDKEPPPPPFWTQSWFQTSVVAVAVVGVVIVAGAYTVKKRKERGPGLTEEEELKLLESETR